MSTSWNKKFLASTVTASAVMAVALVPAGSADTLVKGADSSFKDVSSTYADAVKFLVNNDIASGYNSTKFGTTDSITRGDAAVLIARAKGFDPTKKYKDSKFKDVPAHSKWAVDALVEAGIVNGLNKKEFGASNVLTRNELAKILANAANLPIDDAVKKSKFNDVNIKFAKYVEALVHSGITRGKNEFEFGAYSLVTRGEMALFISRGQEHFGFMELMVMHMNDSHAYLERFPYIATAVKETRAKNENNLLLHAGDVFSGDLYYNQFKGQADVELMNEIGFDAMTFGNHEFDAGNKEGHHKELGDFVKKAKFPFVSSNVDFSNDPNFTGLQTKQVTSSYKDGNIYNGIVIDVNGQKVGVFGLTTEETPTIAQTGKIEFTNYINEAKKSVKAFEEMGVNKVIALTHIGFDDSLKYDNDLELAKQVEGIDIIVGGHTHSSLKEPKVVQQFDAPTIIVQANEYGKVLGTLDVKFNQKGHIISHEGILLNTDHEAKEATAFKPDQKVAELLAPYTAKVLKLKEQSIGKSSLVKLDGGRDTNNEGNSSVRHSETNLGNLITDAMLKKSREINPETSIAIQNGGGIRTSIEAGDITVGDVLKVLPFGNPLAIMELTGAELKATLEHSVSADTRTGGGLKESGAFLQVSGLKFVYDSSAKAGERITSIKVKTGDEYVELDNNKKYFVATNTFTARGGDGFDVLAKVYEEGRVSEPGFSDYENLIEHMKSLETLEPKVEDRIIDSALLPVVK